MNDTLVRADRIGTPFAGPFEEQAHISMLWELRSVRHAGLRPAQLSTAMTGHSGGFLRAYAELRVDQDPAFARVDTESAVSAVHADLQHAFGQGIPGDASLGGSMRAAERARREAVTKAVPGLTVDRESARKVEGQEVPLATVYGGLQQPGTTARPDKGVRPRTGPAMPNGKGPATREQN
jgi:hypothetical protein